ncbi:probable terpene synthase 11 [Olea europaea var. sylvestris]|uniref:probable terpene synthase 11 n=1 Tax=Olea europaea var. sylvestris TaxID=158386 RepID=UPI000C1CEA10|nr:probable terpene synthase 11 [Olea europaea var. sylvestris]
MRSISLFSQSSSGISGTARSPFQWPINHRFSSDRRDFICKSLPVSSPSATPLIPAENGALYNYIRQPVIVTPEVDDGTKHRELLERTRRELQRSTKLVETLKLIDNLQRLGIAYYFEDDINVILDRFSDGLSNEDLFTTALCFRLLRDNGYKTGSGINSRHL